MTKFFNIFKEPCFWPIFPMLWAKNFFLENPTLSRTNSYGFLAPCQNLEKTKDTISRKRLDRRKDGRTDRPYFIGPFWVPPEVQYRWGQWCSQSSARLTAPLFLNSNHQLAEVFQPPLNIFFLSTGHWPSTDVPLSLFFYKAHCLHA